MAPLMPTPSAVHLYVYETLPSPSASEMLWVEAVRVWPTDSVP